MEPRRRTRSSRGLRTVTGKRVRNSGVRGQTLIGTPKASLGPHESLRSHPIGATLPYSVRNPKRTKCPFRV
ncbi:hypothetical protein FRACA_240009 [Frankia canadensis]|uniref:Uncharacterized protein n=1 Tax=Frankia canadensis TaxID=1836972 RepID=A0A2I2KRP4_9ACTN|nr:hypothetical protein FRACA_240009 [Frankia canadensis]SOU55625.1 hypothetical protein FRACA_240009 [Frankia canadensis]